MRRQRPAHRECLETCIHEAAHAVVAHALGFRVIGVEIHPRGVVAGLCHMTPLPEERGGVEGAAVLVAGDLAVDLIGQGRHPEPFQVDRLPRWWMDQLAVAEPARARFQGVTSATSDVPADDQRRIVAMRGVSRDAAQALASRTLEAHWAELEGIAFLAWSLGCVNGDAVRGVFATVAEERTSPRTSRSKRPATKAGLKAKSGRSAPRLVQYPDPRSPEGPRNPKLIDGNPVTYPARQRPAGREPAGQERVVVVTRADARAVRLPALPRGVRFQ